MSHGFPINPPRTALGKVDPVSGMVMVSPEWYRFFVAVQEMIGGPSNPFDETLLLSYKIDVPKPGPDEAFLAPLPLPPVPDDDSRALAAPPVQFTIPIDELSLAVPYLPGGLVREHDQLDGLGDDDHAQYALLAGRGGAETFVVNVAVPDDAYAAGWNGSANVPTKNAVYDQMELKAPIASPVFTGTVRLPGYTVATLPAAGTAGRMAYVTDALAPAWNVAAVGGGAVVCKVFDNGAAWVAG